jgi:hypothetical protein
LGAFQTLLNGAMNISKALSDVIVKGFVPTILVVSVIWCIWVATQFFIATDCLHLEKYKSLSKSDTIFCVLLNLLYSSSAFEAFYLFFRQVVFGNGNV